MSLTSILSYTNKPFKPFRDFLTESFPTPKFKSNEIIKSEPQTTNYMIVGTAFDYLLRFQLEKEFGGKVFTSNWVAETALKYFDDKRSGTIYSDGNELEDMDADELLELFEKKKNADKTLNKVIHEKFNDCKEKHSEFINSELADINKLIESTLFLARLDGVFRGGIRMKEYITLEPENTLDIDDLRQLLNSCDPNLFKPKEKLILNPTFGEGSRLVGGADADIIVDDTLIDIKVTKDLKLTRPYFNQLIGYYLLYLLGGIDEHKDVEIRNLGIYFARHNYLWTVAVEEIGTDEAFNSAVNILKSRLDK